jgi:hypothetical protein
MAISSTSRPGRVHRTDARGRRRDHPPGPFDRLLWLLVAQARLLDVPILTADPVLARDDVEVLTTA